MRKVRTHLILTVIFLQCWEQARSLNNSEINLHKDLFSDYNPNVMPQQNKSTPVNVTLDMYLMSIDNVDEKRQTITIKAFLEIKWRDAFLTWDPMKYPGVSGITVKNTDIWIPDVALQDTFDKLTELGQEGGKADVKSDGVVTIWPYNIYTVACKISISQFPFDKQQCVFDFLSWSHSTSVLLLKSSQKKPDMTFFTESGEWNLAGSEVKLVRDMYIANAFDHVHFCFVLQRKSLYHIINVIIPVLCISILNIVSFLLPSESGERVSLFISIFLALAVILTTVNSSMPKSSDEVAFLSVYVCLQLLGSALTVMFAVGSLDIFYHERSCALPRILKAFVKLCGVTESNEHYQIETDVPHETSVDCLNDMTDEQIRVSDECRPVTWKMVSRAVDKLCLSSAVCWHVILTASLFISVQY
ncbi:neuronal acetylcholine receptor subunit alpha-5-like [Mercenaria mercenaria]|uniref:neuronal acetylcholine receptor subunit alpha-5-like n=1 Tax=Mercenaria mercenaria TaxID=6596 RepID=UPI00234E9AAB|nr:neuronal acetylcholine receptor subunit alpha-5-like [Mercenaria mercenaria]